MPETATSGKAQSRYHGCTTGPSAMMTVNASSAPRTGDRPCGRISSQAQMAMATAMNAMRTALTAMASRSRVPKASPMRPIVMPMAVGGGVLVPDHEVDSWADALTGVLADPARRAALSRRAVAHAARFGWPVTTDRLLAVYGEAVAHRRAAYRTAG